LNNADAAIRRDRLLCLCRCVRPAFRAAFDTAAPLFFWQLGACCLAQFQTTGFVARILKQMYVAAAAAVRAFSAAPGAQCERSADRVSSPGAMGPDRRGA
jgi:hypothetical protein